MRFVPPLVITEAEIEEGMSILGDAMEKGDTGSGVYEKLANGTSSSRPAGKETSLRLMGKVVYIGTGCFPWRVRGRKGD